MTKLCRWKKTSCPNLETDIPIWQRFLSNVKSLLSNLVIKDKNVSTNMIFSGHKLRQATWEHVQKSLRGCTIARQTIVRTF